MGPQLVSLFVEKEERNIAEEYMLTGRGLSERKLNGPGCTVDWSQLGKFLIYLFVGIWIV